MSFKVYDGAKLEGITTIKESIDFANRFREVATDAMHTMVADEIKSLACLIYDLYHVAGVDFFDEDDADRKPLLSAAMKYRSIRLEDKPANYNYDICFGEHNGTVVAIAFFPTHNCDKLFFEQPEVTQFGYWDNVDPEEGLTEAEWDERKDVWTSVLWGNGIPVECMLNIRLLNTYLLMPDDEYMVEMPSVEQRLKTLANDIAFQRALAEESADGDADERGPVKLRIAAHEKARGQREKTRQEFDGKLNEHLTITDLEQHIPQGE